MIEYRLQYSYQGSCALSFIGIDKKAMGDKQKELEANTDYTVIGLNILTDNQDVLYHDMTTGSQYINFLQGEAVFIGECYTDSQCSSKGYFYAMPENKQVAQIEFDKKCDKQKQSADKYYSKPWV